MVLFLRREFVERAQGMFEALHSTEWILGVEMGRINSRSLEEQIR